MKVALFALLACLSISASAQSQSDVCGGASLVAMEKAAPEKDPAMQVKMDRLLTSHRQSYEQCMATMRRAQQRDERLGIATPPRLTLSPTVIATPATVGRKGQPPATCTVVSSNGKPCVQKVSELLGKQGNPDQVVFENSCSNSIEISVIYKDTSRGLSTVKPGSASTLLCNDCGGVKTTEAVCR